MHRYRAFGLLIESEVRLDELRKSAQAGTAPDLTILKAQFGEHFPPLGHHHEYDFDRKDGVKMMWPGAASARIRSPALVEIESFPNIPEAYLAFPLLGPVMGWMLHTRGNFVLHASSVEVGGKAVAFVGDKGAGKSTTCCSFVQHGCLLITDDLLSITVNDSEAPQFQTAFPQMKLNTSGPLVEIPGATVLPLVMEGFEKRQYRLEKMAEGPFSADYIFVLSRGGGRPSIDWLDPADAITALLRYSYNMRFPDAPLNQQDRPRQFRQAAAIANTARVGTLHVPDDRSRLRETVDFVKSIVADTPS